jgi:xanthine dehydrogenase accessory factor
VKDFFERVAELRRQREVFAVATVVARRPPVSAHLGDHAIVFADGRMEGFVGGACSREIVRRQAREALKLGHGRLVSIRPVASQVPASGSAAAPNGAPDAPDGARGAVPEHVTVPMTCQSEGAIDVYIEPSLRPRSLVVVGSTPVAEALARLGGAMEFDVVRVVDARDKAELANQAAAADLRFETLDGLEGLIARDPDRAAVVVASQGHYDEEALTAALRARAGYVGLVASRRRGAAIRGLLEDSGVAATAAIRVPVGLDLGVHTAPEVALSILAEIVQAPARLSAPRDLSPAASERAVPESVVHESAVHESAVHESAVHESVGPAPTVLERASGNAEPGFGIDPVCGMRVDIADASHRATLDGVEYSFCSAGCRARFVRDPQAFLQPHA